MPTLLRWTRVALALLVFLAVANCGEQQARDDGRRGPGGVPGAPINQQDDAEAIGAPIRVPTIAFAGQPSLAEVRQAVEQRIREQCGGELCVQVVVEQRDLPGVSACDFAGIEPEPGTWVKRGTTIVIVSGAEPCDEPSDDPGWPDEEDGGDEQSDEPEAPDDDPEPSDDDPSQSPSTP